MYLLGIETSIATERSSTNYWNTVKYYNLITLLILVITN